MKLRKALIHGYKGHLVLNERGHYVGYVFVMRDPGQGRSWKNIEAHPVSDYQDIRTFFDNEKSAAEYLCSVF